MKRLLLHNNYSRDKYSSNCLIFLYFKSRAAFSISASSFNCCKILLIPLLSSLSTLWVLFVVVVVVVGAGAGALLLAVVVVGAAAGALLSVVVFGEQQHQVLDGVSLVCVAERSYNKVFVNNDSSDNELPTYVSSFDTIVNSFINVYSL